MHLLGRIFTFSPTRVRRECTYVLCLDVVFLFLTNTMISSKHYRFGMQVSYLKRACKRTLYLTLSFTFNPQPSVQREVECVLVLGACGVGFNVVSSDCCHLFDCRGCVCQGVSLCA